MKAVVEQAKREVEDSGELRKIVHDESRKDLRELRMLHAQLRLMTGKPAR